MFPARFLGSLLAAVVALALTTVSAAAQQSIGPNQQFAGAVNGSAVSATVIMVCPIGVQFGHPKSGQGVQVIENVGSGFTGAGNRIVATLGPGPSSAIGASFTFTEYGLPQDIPVSAFLPCSGTGIGTFVPQPASATGRSSLVTLHFVNIAG
jgi:hypothetical protein